VQTSKHASFAVVLEDNRPLPFAYLEKKSDELNVLMLQNLNSTDEVIALRCGVRLTDRSQNLDCTEMDKHSLVITVAKNRSKKNNKK